MRKFLIIGLGIVVFLGIIFLVMFLENLKTSDESFPPIPTPVIGQRSPSPAVNYDKEAVEKLLENVTTRPTPTEERDVQIRARFIQELEGKSGYIRQTTDYNVSYVLSPDDFEAEIKTFNVDEAKTEIINFFRESGMSEDGICKLPLVFFLSPNVSQQLRGSEVKFSPIPDFCK